MKKIRLHSEPLYVLATVIVALAVSFISASDLGLSQIVAPAYLLSAFLTEKGLPLTFGQCEYIVQGILMIVFCIVVRKLKISYFFAFFSALFYGAVLDLIRLIPIFNPNVTTPEMLGWPLRIVFFAVGLTLTEIGVMLHFKSYLFPQVADFFVTGVVSVFGVSLGKIKSVFDLGMLAISLAMTFLFFGRLVGVGVGTIIAALINGTAINLYSRLFDRYFEVVPLWPKLASYFTFDPIKKKENAETNAES